MHTIELPKFKRIIGSVCLLITLFVICVAPVASASVVYEKALQDGATLLITCKQTRPLPVPKDYMAKLKPIKGVTFGTPMMPASVIYRFYLVPEDRRTPKLIGSIKEITYPGFTGRIENGKQPEFHEVNEFFPGFVFVDGAISDKTLIVVYRWGNGLHANVIPLIGKHPGIPVLKHPDDILRTDIPPGGSNPPLVSDLTSSKITGSVKKGTLRIDIMCEVHPDWKHIADKLSGRLAYTWNGKNWSQIEGPSRVLPDWMLPKKHSKP